MCHFFQIRKILFTSNQPGFARNPPVANILLLIFSRSRTNDCKNISFTYFTDSSKQRFFQLNSLISYAYLSRDAFLCFVPVMTSFTSTCRFHHSLPQCHSIPHHSLPQYRSRHDTIHFHNIVPVMRLFTSTHRFHHSLPKCHSLPQHLLLRIVPFHTIHFHNIVPVMTPFTIHIVPYRSHHSLLHYRSRHDIIHFHTSLPPFTSTMSFPSTTSFTSTISFHYTLLKSLQFIVHVLISFSSTPFTSIYCSLPLYLHTVIVTVKTLHF